MAVAEEREIRRAAGEPRLHGARALGQREAKVSKAVRQ